LNTERLFYQDAYLREFTARVLARRDCDGRECVALDRSAFYPTGGGQPNDTGVLGGVPVIDVFSDDALIWHTLGGPLGTDQVTGAIDWGRRFDHMQQHTGQHVLSEAFIETLSAETVAFHLGTAASTIDVSRTELGSGDLAATESAANRVIDSARPVTAVFVEPSSLASVPLRKPPKVTGQIRVVEVAGFDWSACGGTHVANSAQIGLIKIVGAERRGPETRITFLCGGRARAGYARLQALAEGLVARFTTGQDELLQAVDRQAAENKSLRKELGELEAQWVDSTAAVLWAGAEPLALSSDAPDGRFRVVAQVVDYPSERARRVAQALRSRPGAVVLLGVRGERPQLIFGRADDVALNIGELLRSAAAAAGGRGGGRPEWAQGGVPVDAGLEVALAAALAALPKACDGVRSGDVR